MNNNNSFLTFIPPLFIFKIFFVLPLLNLWIGNCTGDLAIEAWENCTLGGQEKKRTTHKQNLPSSPDNGDTFEHFGVAIPPPLLRTSCGKVVHDFFSFFFYNFLINAWIEYFKNLVYICT